MVVAVPTQGPDVVSHWGHSPEISLYQIPSPESTPFKVLRTEEGCACKSGLAQILHAEHVTHVLVGQIGGGAFAALQRFGITVIRGVSGPSAQAVSSLALGNLSDNQQLCGHADCPEDTETHIVPGFGLRNPQ